MRFPVVARMPAIPFATLALPAPCGQPPNCNPGAATVNDALLDLQAQARRRHHQQPVHAAETRRVNANQFPNC